MLVSALNEELDRIDAAYGIDVFWKAFLSNRDGFGMGVPAVPLEASIRSRSGTAFAATAATCARDAESAELCGFRMRDVAAIRLDDGSVLKARLLHRRRSIRSPVENVAASVCAAPMHSRTPANLRPSPITSVHLWFDRPVMTEPFLTSVDQTIQWVFNKDPKGQYIQVVISASHALAESRNKISSTCAARNSAICCPPLAHAKLVRSHCHSRKCRYVFARTWLRPLAAIERTPLRNLFLAGDWTRTGWPATMEGAVRSGYRAAETILGIEGKFSSVGPARHAGFRTSALVGSLLG